MPSSPPLELASFPPLEGNRPPVGNHGTTAWCGWSSNTDQIFCYYKVACLVGSHKVKKGRGKLGTYAMERVAAGAHRPTPWLFEPAKCPDDRGDYCMDPSRI